MCTNDHDDHLVFTTAQQDLVLIARLSQGTHNGLELNDTLCLRLNYLLEEWLVLHEMHYAHLPDLCCQMLRRCNGQWL